MNKLQRRSLSKVWLADAKKKNADKPSMAEKLAISGEKIAAADKANAFKANTSEDFRHLGIESQATKPAKLTGQDLITHFEQITDATERNAFYTKNRALILKAYGLQKF